VVLTPDPFEPQRAYLLGAVDSRRRTPRMLPCTDMPLAQSLGDALNRRSLLAMLKAKPWLGERSGELAGLLTAHPLKGNTHAQDDK
jgi:hypothetical protein